MACPSPSFRRLEKLRGPPQRACGAHGGTERVARQVALREHLCGRRGGAPRVARRREGHVMAGHLVLVVGPSGAGKDSVLNGARERFREDRSVVFPRRFVTRLSNAAAEDHISLTEMEFAIAVAGDTFALWWRAHGNYYGIGRSIEGDLAAGAVVAVNCSRTGHQRGGGAFWQCHGGGDYRTRRCPRRPHRGPRARDAGRGAPARFAAGGGLSARHYACPRHERRPAGARRGPILRAAKGPGCGPRSRPARRPAPA
jgi:hypothetical protein